MLHAPARAQPVYPVAMAGRQGQLGACSSLDHCVRALHHAGELDEKDQFLLEGLVRDLYFGPEADA